MQVAALEEALVSVRGHAWCQMPCLPMFDKLRALQHECMRANAMADRAVALAADEADRVLVREQSPISPLVVQARACKLVQRHTNVVTNIWCACVSRLATAIRSWADMSCADLGDVIHGAQGRPEGVRSAHASCDVCQRS